MKNFIKNLCCIAVIFTAMLSGAGEADERRLGDRAFFMGDYHTAVSCYRTAQKLAEQENLTEAWADDTLRLGKAQLFAGDAAGAQATLKEFRRRHPMRSAGTLTGDLLAAANKFDEALRFYRTLEQNPDPEVQAAAKFSRALIFLQQEKYTSAREIFAELSRGNSRWKLPAMREAAYVAICQKRYDEALQILGQIPAENRFISCEILRFLAQAKQGRYDGFKNVWQVVLERQTRRPDARTTELLTTVATLAENRGDTAFASEMLKQVDFFADSPAVRKILLKRLFNLQSRNNAAGAAVTAANFSRLFPDDPERFELQLAAAAILGKAQMFDRSTAIVQQLISDRNSPRNIRFRAAEAGVIFAERGKNFPLAVQFFQTAIKSAEDNASASLQRKKYIEFLLRNGDFRNAVKESQAALKLCTPAERSGFYFLLLDAAVKAGDKSLIRESTAELLTAKNMMFKARANYESGMLAAADKKFHTARRFFQTAAQMKDGGKYRIAGQFAAARMAFNQKDYRTAGKEFLTYAGNYPTRTDASLALYLGYRAGRLTGDEKLKNACARSLSEKYPDSEAAAVYGLQNAADRAARERDIVGAIAELENLERRFAGNPEIVSEAMIMRGTFLENSGRHQDALECVTALYEKYPDSRAAFNAALCAGNIRFNAGAYQEALQWFKNAGKLRDSGLEQEIAAGRTLDAMLQLGDDSNMIDAAIELSGKQIEKSVSPALRIQFRFKRALALERAGKADDALACYEKIFYEAWDCQKNNIPYDLVWCVRACSNAMNIITASRKRSMFNRGIRILAIGSQLGLDARGLNLKQMRIELEEKYSSAKKRR